MAFVQQTLLHVGHVGDPFVVAYRKELRGLALVPKFYYFATYGPPYGPPEIPPLARDQAGPPASRMCGPGLSPLQVILI